MKTRALIRTLACAALAVCANWTLADDVAKPEQPAQVKPVQERPEVAEQPATPSTQPDADAGKPTTPATTQPADQAAAPATQPAEAVAKATVSPEAQKVLDDVSAAYGKLKTLELVGVFSGHFDAAGQQSGGTIAFTSSFQTPNKFRHTSKDDVLIGSNGDKAYAYGAEDNVYAQADAPKDKVATKDLPIGFRDLLSAQNPSLRLALAKDPAIEMIEDVKDVTKIDDIKVGDVSCPALKLTLNDKTLLTLAIDPTTHLIRRTSLDLRAKLESKKIPDIKEAFYSVDYTTITPDAPVKDEQFAWAPPGRGQDLKDMKEPAADNTGGATELVGKDAPDFKLASLDGKILTKADFKDKVYILDFWATWCPPCRASLPHLSELYQAEKATGLIVYAVNLQEEKNTVEDFIAKTKLGVPVLLDSDGKAAASFKAEAIPETVVVGKDGKVVKVVVGFDPDATPKELKAAVDEAMKK